MSIRLRKQWKITTDILKDSFQILYKAGCSDKAEKDFNEYISHNELELALDVLEEEGGHHISPLGKDFWFNLKKAAEIMGLENRYNYYREKIRSS